MLNIFKISLNNFRCWNNIVLKFPIGKITLIKGYTGIGKTTILQAISWCLYGNIRRVSPNSIKNAKTKVNIEFPYIYNGINDILHIERQKNPNRLILRHEGIDDVYEDKVAQSLIDDFFGTYDIWMASCYIGQGCRNNFLTSPNTGKMELLNIIAFHEEDPRIYIEKIDKEILKKEEIYKIKLGIYKKNLENLESLLLKNDLKKYLKSDEVLFYKEKIGFLTIEIETMKIEKAERDIKIGVLENLEKQLEKIEIIDYPTDDIDIVMKTIPMLERRNDLIKNIEFLESSIENIKKNYDFRQNFEKEDYHETISKELQIEEEKRKCKILKVDYNKINIENMLRQYEDILISQDSLKLLNDYNNLLKKVKTDFKILEIPEIVEKIIPIPDYNIYSTLKLNEILSSLLEKQGELNAHIKHLEKSQDVIKCPHCYKSVRYNQGNLIISDIGPIDQTIIQNEYKNLSNIKNEIIKINKEILVMKEAEKAEKNAYEKQVIEEQKRIKFLKEQINQIKLDKQREEIENENLLKQLNDIKIKLESAPKPVSNILLTSKQIEETKLSIIQLKNIKILDIPITSSDYIKKFLEYKNLCETLENYKKEYSSYILNIKEEYRFEDFNKLKELFVKLNNSNELKKLKDSLESQIFLIKSVLKEDFTHIIEEKKIELNSLIEALKYNEEIQKIIDFHAKVKAEREIVSELNNDLSNLQTLKEYAIDTECKILQEIVDNINLNIQTICESLFDQDINISLNLFKTLKTNKNIKPEVNFTISYKGGKYDQINQMSGGEGDRASLALTLALNRLSSCPILMFDESLSSLDLDTKEIVINTIRENTNSTVLIVMHDGTEGIFDEVFNIDELKI